MTLPISNVVAIYGIHSAVVGLLGIAFGLFDDNILNHGSVSDRRAVVHSSLQALRAGDIQSPTYSD